MPTSRRYIAAIAVAATLGVVGPAVVPAQAFDPAKVLEGEVSSRTVFQYYFEARKEGKEDEAVSVLKYAAERGNPAAQWKLGRMYETGDGVKRNALAAFNIFKGITERHSGANPNSADGRFASEAMVALGRYYHKGIPAAGIAPDIYQARVMFTTAAMVYRNASAQFELGRMNLENTGGRRNPKLAARMLRLSSNRGNAGARALLGNMIFEGDYLPANPVEGLVMISRAKNTAKPQDYEWISRLQEDAYATATREQREMVSAKLAE